MQSRRQLRSNNGQGIIEGVVGLVMLIIGAVLAVLLLVNASVSGFYKERIGFITQKTADFAALKAGKPDANSSVQAYARDLLKESGLPSLKELTTETLTVGGQEAVRVNLTVQGLVLIGSGDVLPREITLSDRAVSPIVGSSAGGDGVLQVVLQGNRFAYSLPARKVDLGGAGQFVGGNPTGFQNLRQKMNPEGSFMFIKPVGSPDQMGDGTVSNNPVTVKLDDDGVNNTADSDF